MKIILLIYQNHVGCSNIMSNAAKNFDILANQSLGVLHNYYYYIIIINYFTQLFDNVTNLS